MNFIIWNTQARKDMLNYTFCANHLYDLEKNIKRVKLYNNHEYNEAVAEMKAEFKKK